MTTKRKTKRFDLGGKIKVYNDMDTADDINKYQHSPAYWGKEDPSPLGREAVRAAEKAAKDNDGTFPIGNDKLRPSDMPAVNAAKKVIKEKDDLVKELKEKGNPYKKGGAVKMKSASSRADGIAQRGKTRGRYL